MHAAPRSQLRAVGNFYRTGPDVRTSPKIGILQLGAGAVSCRHGRFVQSAAVGAGGSGGLGACGIRPGRVSGNGGGHRGLRGRAASIFGGRCTGWPRNWTPARKSSTAVSAISRPLADQPSRWPARQAISSSRAGDSTVRPSASERPALRVQDPVDCRWGPGAVQPVSSKDVQRPGSPEREATRRTPRR